MILKQEIEAKNQCKVLAMYPIQCRRFKIHVDGREEFLREEIHAAYLTQVEGEQVIGFWPGVTGYESYYVSSAKTSIQRNKNNFVPKDTVFGKSHYQYTVWYLNAGAALQRDALSTTHGEIEHVLNELLRIHRQEK